VCQTDTDDYILITNLMHELLFIHKIIFSSTCFEPQVLIFRRIQFVHVQHMILPLSMRVLGGLSVNSLICVSTGHQELS